MEHVSQTSPDHFHVSIVSRVYASMRMIQFNHFGNDTCNRNTCMLKLNFLIFFLLKIVYAKIALQYKFLILLSSTCILLWYYPSSL